MVLRQVGTTGQDRVAIPFAISFGENGRYTFGDCRNNPAM